MDPFYLAFECTQSPASHLCVFHPFPPRWIQAELQAANWSELMFFSSSCSQCFPISLYSLAVANLYPLVLRSPFRRDIPTAIFWGYRWAKHVPETLWATNASLLLAVTYVISINIHAYVYIYIHLFHNHLNNLKHMTEWWHDVAQCAHIGILGFTTRVMSAVTLAVTPRWRGHI